MKQILVTGANSYIGRAFSQYIEQFPDEYRADALSLRGESWKTVPFSPFDTVLHTVGLAHVKETKETAPLFYKINRDLAVAVAEKAKAEGVRQFLFLSSMSVYGVEEGIITPDTIPRPGSSYGKSKLEAEQRLLAMQAEGFRVAVLRPPMVYGPGCKGNYQTLVKLAKRLPVCPDYENQRSVISIERLCAEIRRLIDEDAAGVFVPQDPEYMCTCRRIRQLAEEQGRHLPAAKALGFGPAFLRRFTVKGRKAFGSLVYQGESQCSHAGVQR